MDFEEPFVAALQDAVTPSRADVMVARGVILAALSGTPEPQRMTDFEDAWLSAQNATKPPDRTQYHADNSAEPGRQFADPDRQDPHLMEVRARHAVRRAVGELLAEGIVLRGEGNQHDLQPERISIAYSGGGSSAPVFVHSPLIGEPGNTPRFMLARQPDEGSADALLPTDEMVEGLEPILGMRGLHLVREARKALQRGLFVASSSLLAAASEAAWFNLARALAEPGKKLAQLVDAGRDISEVIRLTEQHLLALKINRALVTEVVSQGHLFRDIRNYALHPVEAHDQDREAWLTETGATLLTIAARRYFVKMATLLTAGTTSS